MTGLQPGDLALVGGALLCIALGVGVLLGKVPPSGIESVRDKPAYRVLNGRLAIAIGLVMMLVFGLQRALPSDQARVAVTAVTLAGLVALAFALVPILRMRNRGP